MDRNIRLAAYAGALALAVGVACMFYGMIRGTYPSLVFFTGSVSLAGLLLLGLEYSLVGVERPTAPKRTTPLPDLAARDESEADTDEETAALDLGWSFHRVPAALAVVGTLTFYVICYFLAKVV